MKQGELFEISVTYGSVPFKLNAEIEYHSSQIMRIRVYGSKNSILLSNNRPMLDRITVAKKGILWKILKAIPKSNDLIKDHKLLHDIIDALEEKIRSKE